MLLIECQSCTKTFLVSRVGGGGLLTEDEARQGTEVVYVCCALGHGDAGINTLEEAGNMWGGACEPLELQSLSMKWSFREKERMGTC